MAKIGEGDQRWIVQDRADGANVHNWHWAERDCLEWARKRFSELLGDVEILDGQGSLWIKTSKVDSVEGEAYVNIRKGKIIPGYELHVRLSWLGEAKAGDGETLGKVEGKIEFPYIADENADEEPELKVSVAEAGPINSRLREAMLAEGKPLLLKRVQTFVKEMAAGGPAKDELAAKAAGKEPNVTSKSIATGSTNKSVESKQAKDAVLKAKDREREGVQSITLTERFHCRRSDLYDVLMDERRWKAFTQSNARISPEIGGAFSLFDGAVTGVNQQLQRGELIVQKWRFNNWADGHYSTVCITIDEPEVGVTILKLSHTNIPEEDRFGNATVVETTQRGWKELIFYKIRAVFGYGM